MKKKKKIAIITGANGVIGHEYLRRFSQIREMVCFGIVRTEPTQPLENVRYIKADLLDQAAVKNNIREFLPENTDEIILIHAVGKFKFELSGQPEKDLDNDGIDDEVKASNVDTFLNLINPILKKYWCSKKKPRIVICGLGSVSDEFDPDYWKSFSKSKNILREHIKKLIWKDPEHRFGLFLNVSSVNTENENRLRPSADLTYWLKAEEIVSRSINSLLNPKTTWKELNIYKHNPEYYEGYYKGVKVLKRWQKQMEMKN